MNNGDALILAIHRNPDDDTLWGAYADYLDEHATTDAERARAELIRVQCRETAFRSTHQLLQGHQGDLDRPNDSSQDLLWHCKPTCLLCQHLKDEPREQELIDTYSVAWRRPACMACEGWGWHPFPDPAGGSKLSNECRTCKGTGSTGALSERTVRPLDVSGIVKAKGWKHNVTWVRGMPVVDVAFADIGMTSATTTWMYPLWLAWAIRAVREGASFNVMGRTPIAIDVGYGWYGNNIPFCILNAMRGHENGLEGKLYKTLELALAALNTAVTQLVVEKAYQ